MMHIESLYTPHKPAMRALIEAIVADQGLHPGFYWPMDLLGAEMATTEAVGVFEESELAGFVLYREVPGVWEISLVATHPKFRRKGLMEALISHLIAAKGQGTELWLEVHQDNHSAQKLYEKLGFTMVGRRARYYKDGATALLYSCP